MTEHQCIDCKKNPPPTVRKIADGEITPRCATHLREAKLRRKKRARATSVERTYGLSAEDNHALFLLQGGKCWLCQRATGATKSLAVDHDHATGEVRGRLCGPCNQFIGRLRDSPEAAQRLSAYLTGDTPYRRLKASQVLTEAFEESVVVSRVISSGVALFADWKPANAPELYGVVRTLVYTPHDGWLVIE